MNNRILTLLLTIFVIITLMGVASSLSRLGPNAGFSNPGDVSIGGSMTIGGNLAVGGSTVDTGVINTNTNMGIGYDLGCLTGDSIVDFHLGTGLFKTTTGAITIGGGINGISLNGPVTGASAKSWTMAGASTLTVGSTGVTAVGGTVNFIVPVSGTDGAFSGEVTGENIASTDDARIADKLHVLGTLGVAGTATLNALVVNTTSTSNGGPTVASGQILAVTTADKLTVGGIIVPQEMTLNWPINAASVDENIFIANEAWEVTKIEEAHTVVGSDIGAVTVSLKVCDGTEAPSAGDAAQSAAFDLKGAANTVQTGTLSATKTLADGNRLGLDYTGTLTALAGGVVTVHLKRV